MDYDSDSDEPEVMHEEFIGFDPTVEVLEKLVLTLDGTDERYSVEVPSLLLLNMAKRLLGHEIERTLYITSIGGDA
jgi:hypothetical protein